MLKKERIGIKEDVITEQVVRINNEQRQEVRDVYKGSLLFLETTKRAMFRWKKILETQKLISVKLKCLLSMNHSIKNFAISYVFRTYFNELKIEPT